MCPGTAKSRLGDALPQIKTVSFACLRTILYAPPSSGSFCAAEMQHVSAAELVLSMPEVLPRTFFGRHVTAITIGVEKKLLELGKMGAYLQCKTKYIESFAPVLSAPEY